MEDSSSLRDLAENVSLVAAGWSHDPAIGDGGMDESEEGRPWSDQEETRRLPDVAEGKDDNNVE